jgi:hypothetical protein
MVARITAVVAVLALMALTSFGPRVAELFAR